jgi:DNA-binding response OmpR family regulator
VYGQCGDDEDRERDARLKAGADDYVTRPFSVCELMAHIKAVLRRAQKLTLEF